MSLSDIDAWLHLNRLPGIGPAAIRQLLDHFGSPAAALQSTVAEWRRAGLSETKAGAISNEVDISEDLRWLEIDNHHAITLSDARYPALLRDIDSPPSMLFVHGDPDLLNYPQLAVVGSRNVTRSGEKNAYAFSRYLAQSGLGITSGLALGVDAASHQGALDGNGITLAIAGTGLDRVYPAANRELAHRIASEGAIVSEFAIGTRPVASNFPRRNRIIAGLSLGTLVVEAAQKSGSLITARLASEQGREVFAIPGSIHNPVARGCHQLIRQGAKLVETGDDILEELGALISLPKQRFEVAQNPPRERQPDHKRVLRAIDYDPTPVDMIITRSGFSATDVTAILLMLELENLIASEPGGYSRLTSDD